MYKNYRNVLLHNSSKYCLIGKIKGLSIEAKKTRKKFLKNPEKNVGCFWTKVVIGYDIRHHLLAYALMRGLPYSALEAKCREDNKPTASKIRAIVHAHVYPHQVVFWTEEKVASWLNGEKV